MKKSVYFLGIAAIVGGCQEVQTETPVLDGSIIEAVLPKTKTQFTTPLSVDWEDSDKLYVVLKNTPEGESSTPTSTPYTFNKSTESANAFTCEGFKSPEGDNVFNIVYSANEVITGIDDNGVTTSAITVGSAADGVQTQSGIGANNTVVEHIKAPLCGYATTIAEPVIMKHFTTLLNVQITNNLTSAVTVTKVTVTNNQENNLVGTFYVKPEDGTITGLSASNVATLDVTGGEISAGGVGNFYLVTAPFTLPANNSITVTVTTSDENTYMIDKTAADLALNFSAGKVNTLKVTLNRSSKEVIPAAAFATYYNTSDGRGADRLIDKSTSTLGFHTPYKNTDYQYSGEDNTYNCGDGLCMQQNPLFLDIKFSTAETIDYMILTGLGQYSSLGICNIYWTTSESDYSNTSKEITESGITGTSWQMILPPDGSSYKNTAYIAGSDYKTDKFNAGAWNLGEKSGTHTLIFPEQLTNVVAIRLHCINGYGGQVQIDELQFFKYVASTDTSTSGSSSSESTEGN